MIKTYEELAALPEETPLRDAGGFVWESAVLATEYAVVWGYDTVLPAVLLTPATISREQFEAAVQEYQKPRQHVNGSGDAVRANLAAALAVLGIEVGDE